MTMKVQIIKNKSYDGLDLVVFISALFSLKKSIRDYQKRLSFLENASFDNRKSVKFLFY